MRQDKTGSEEFGLIEVLELRSKFPAPDLDNRSVSNASSSLFESPNSQLPTPNS
ncbi:hypothetical protein [Chamaesiphon polymorphus]|uniref:hypothetical protein n=1 Tax=Chamaesiphon polymorphus TaxID=2107691 RepID=UPI0015E7C00F|nr:hypothetical protein [Chamaesiphon polymorphus]